MKVTVKGNNLISTMELDSDELVENLKAILEVEVHVPLMHQQLWFEGKELFNSTRLNENGICENSILTLVTTTNLSGKGPIGGGHWSINKDGATSNVGKLQKHLQGNPNAMAQLQQSQGRPSKRQHQEKQEPNTYSQHNNNSLAFEPKSTPQLVNNQPLTFANHDLMFVDPFDIDAQRRIEETIRQKNVDDNWEAAIEHNPEAFARVIMLFVDMEVNGFPMKAFVDSGAQSTIISMYCAECCGLLRLLDRRYTGIAKGVGQSMIVGRIHVAPLKIGRNYYPCSFTVLEHADIEFIFGLDMLRKHQCTIDLKENVLWIGGGEHAVPFLQEKDLPIHSFAEQQQTEETAQSTEAMTRDYTTRVHPPIPLHIPLAQGHQQSSVEPNQGDTKTLISPQRNNENAKVQRLVDLGFDKKQVLDALSLFHGNEEQAAGYLFES